MSAKMYRTQERMVAGVCGGLAEHLGVKVGLVRAIMLGASFFFGAGLVFYGWLWLLVPMAGMKPGSAALCWTRTATPG